MSASKIGSITVLSAACTTRSRTAGIDNGLRSLLPGFGMNTRRAATGGSCRPSDPRPARQAAWRYRTPRRRRWSVGRCRPRPCWRAPAPTPTPRRPCGRPCHRARGTSSGIGLGRPVERSLQFSDFERLGGPSHEGTHRPFPVLTHERSSGPSLTPGSVVPRAQAVIRPPPTPTQHHAHFPDHRL